MLCRRMLMTRSLEDFDQYVGAHEGDLGLVWGHIKRLLHIRDLCSLLQQGSDEQCLGYVFEQVR